VQVYNRWEEVERLFHAALEHDPAHRTEFLSKICSDPDVLAEVNSLLEAHEKGGSVLDQPPNRVAAEFLEEFDARQDSLIGSAFDHYEITGVLGEGAMGKVYLAQDSRLMRKVALKILPAPHVQSLDRLRRFAQEARVASALNHPNIITVYDYGQAFSSYYIATEYVEGRTLRALIGDGINPRAALEIAIQMASAFAAAHQAGIIHRDIKPENIMVRADGLVKVLDFGLAKLAPQSDPITSLGDSPATVPGAVIGTFCYMSPEQARGRDLDARTDIFSFGIVMYEMLAGRRPFEGDELPDLLTSLVGSDPPPLSTFLPEAPAELETILAGALARDRDHRYQSFDALLDDLMGVRSRLDGGESATVPFQPSIGHPPTPGYPPQRSSAPLQTLRQSRGGVGSLANQRPHIVPSRLKPYLIATAAVVLMAAVYVVIKEPAWLVKKGSIREVDLVRKVTYDGEASIDAVAVSPDGQHFAYVRKGELSILATPASEQDNPRAINHVPCPNCGGVTFSRDSGRIYYVAGEPEKGSLYRMSIEGGSPEKITDDVSRSISFSPQGDRFVFVRNSKRALVTANADGASERTLATSDHSGDVWLFPAWSPDGKVVACGSMNLASRDEEVVSVDVADGSKRIIPSQIKWARIRSLAWASNSELIVNSAGDQSQTSGLWLISYPAGQARKMTTDLNDFYGASLTADSRMLVSVRVDYSMNLYVGSGSDPGAAKKVNLGPLNNYGFMGLCWTPDRKIIYSAGPVGRKDLYEYDPSGPERGQPLTSHEGDNTYPFATPDNKYIVFASDRDGSLSVWRIDRNGSNPKKLTSEGLRPSCCLDGQWVVFQITKSGEHTSLWKVSIDGGAAVTLDTAGEDAENSAVSPDGQRVAYVLKSSNGASAQVAVLGLNQQERDTYNLPVTLRLPIIRWRDVGALLYIDQWGDRAEMWEQRLDRQSPPQLFPSSSHADFNSILNFDWRDGRMVLSAGQNSRSDVVALTLVDQHR
jgi:serine/threonine protein kinase/Tol biopolymer transport system component